MYDGYLGPAIVTPNGILDRAAMDAYYHSMIFTQDLGCGWDYAAEWYLMKASNFNFRNDSYSRYGICQYLTYQITCKVGVGFRGEWMRDSDWDADFYAATFGANWAPVQCLMVRPEIRYDWHHGNNVAVFNKGNNSEQLSGGVSVMYKF